jgi:hypothetical protein
MIDRRIFIGACTATLVGARVGASAQHPAKLPRIGALISSSPPHPFADAFRRGLQPLGYVEGENISNRMALHGRAKRPRRGARCRAGQAQR